MEELDIPCESELMEVRVLGGESIGHRRVASYIVESIEEDYTAAVPNAMVATLLTTHPIFLLQKETCRGTAICLTFPSST